MQVLNYLTPIEMRQKLLNQEKITQSYDQVIYKNYVSHHCLIYRTPTDNPKMESINVWIKHEIMNDWNIDSYDSFDKFINAYIYIIIMNV